MSINEQIAEHYEELRAFAHRLLGRGGGTLRTTALVHEVFLKLRAGSSAEAYTQAHLMNLAARTMRQVLVDAARKSASEKTAVTGNGSVFRRRGQRLSRARNRR